MTDNTQRFSDRVGEYARSRPGYPDAILDLLRRECGLTRESVVADVGSGTGLLARLFLAHGNRVYGVEPNAPMRAAGERALAAFSRFASVDGAAEATTLPDGSVDIVTAGQAFHWFEPAAARAELSRIMRPEGWVVLVWNERRIGGTPFLEEYERLLLRYGTDYGDVRHANGGSATALAGFFRAGGYRTARYDNRQEFDLAGLASRLLSSSYTPPPGHPDHEPMLRELARVFGAHEGAGRVVIEYDTRVYYGR